MSGLSIEHITKSFGSTLALDDVTFQVAESEIIAIVGPSGSGKSTLLGIIAGLDLPDRGQVLWDGEPLRQVPVYRRGFGLMFQDFALFPHRSVAENVAFGLQMARWDRERIAERVDEVLELVGLPGFGDRDVNTLSGGEQQRVALARSLAPRPRLLMLDEPLGSLDRALRERLVVDLRHILRSTRQTALYVTHDQEEAYSLADRVVVMNLGRVEQIGAPQEIYLSPASAFVARFLGLHNLLPGAVIHRDGQTVVRTPAGEWPSPPHQPGEVTVLLRPDSVQVNGDLGAHVEGVLEETTFRGSQCRAVLDVNGFDLRFDFPSQVDLPSPGERLRLSFDPQVGIQLFPPQSTRD